MKIAIVGRMRSGKNTVADLIETHLDMCYPEYTDVKQLAFGDKMKQLFSLAHGRPFNKETDRKLIQDFGQGARQILDEEIWVYPVVKEVAKRDGNHQVTIVTDARQFNELFNLSCQECHIIYIETDAMAQVERMTAKGEEASVLELGHSTENVEQFRHLCDYIVYNGKDTTLADLLTQVEDIISDIIEG